jgi:hypothetical protein
MAGITRVVITDLYWDTLSELRGTPCYDQALASIKTCIANKMVNRNHQSGNDTPFSAQKELKGIWHCRIVNSPLKILFYKVEGETLSLCKVGTHDDYGWKGKNSKAAERLQQRIAHSIGRGNVAFANWTCFRWNDPRTVIGHPDVALLSKSALRELDDALFAEYQNLTLLARKHGGDLSKVSTDQAVEWMSHIETARAYVADVMTRRPALERLYREANLAAYTFKEPNQKEFETMQRSGTW